MRIISSFHDYYDSALSYGADESLIYLREKKEEKISTPNEKKKLPELISSFNRLSNEYKEKIMYLGFCGKIYPLIKVSKVLGENVKYFYSLDEFKEFSNSIGHSLSSRDDSYFRFYDRVSLSSEKSLSQFFKNERSSLNLNELTSFFSKFNVPIFLLSTDEKRDYVLTLNPSLKELEFQKQMDAFRTNQEISMFVGGVLKSSENPMEKISDKDKISKHGFDRWSFRKKGKNSK